MRKRNSSRRNRFGNYEDRNDRDRNLYESNSRRYRGRDVYDTNTRQYSGDDHYDDVADNDNYSVGRWSSGSNRNTNRSRNRNDQNIVERAGYRIRDTWSRWTDREEPRRSRNDNYYNEPYENYQSDYENPSLNRYNVNDESNEYGWYGERNRSAGNQNPSFTNEYYDRGAYRNNDYDYSTERDRDRYLDDTVNNGEGNHPSRYYDDQYIEHNIDQARRALRGRRLRRGKTRYAW